MDYSILFHIPKPVVTGSAIGSKVRPQKLIAAFRSLNCEVELVAGGSAERKKIISKVLSDIKKGRHFDFLYSESSNAPIPVSDDHHIPLHPFMDYRFYNAVRQAGIPSGLYYRDVFWKFPVFREKLSLPLRLLTYPLYLSDWRVFCSYIDHLFLPSERMAAHLHTPWPEDRVSRLPPGCDIHEHGQSGREDKLVCFYVGGIEPPVYDLKSMIDTFITTQHARLVLCCRQREWQSLSGYYGSDPRNIDVVHASGEQLQQYYSAADVFIAAWNQDPYMDIAMPIKIFESLGHGVPVIISAGSEAADFIRSTGTGWVIDNLQELPFLLQRLQANREEIDRYRQAAIETRSRHTWQERAKQIITTLARGHG